MSSDHDPATPRGGAGRTAASASRWRLAIAASAAAALLVGGAAYARFGRGRRGARSGAQHGLIEALPYVNYVPVLAGDLGKAGVTKYDKQRAAPGYNLYVAKPEYEARLVDMTGEVVHTWSSGEGQLDPGLKVPDLYRGWFTVRMTPKGDLLAVIGRRFVMKVDWGSHVLWKAKVAAHHEIVVADDGDAYVLSEEPRMLEVQGRRRLIADDQVVILSPEGDVKKRISVYDAIGTDEALRSRLEDAIGRSFARLDRLGLDRLVEKYKARVENQGDEDRDYRLAVLAKPGRIDEMRDLLRTGDVRGDPFDANLLMHAVPGYPSDVMHANAIVVLKAHPAGLWKDGDVMVSIRHLNTLLVIDPATGAARWSWGQGELQGQHQPSLLPNGDLLVLDNGHDVNQRSRRDYSRVVEVDPAKRAIVWSYLANPPTDFWTPGEGGAEMLPNGDVLVTESSKGRAFEVTRSKEIVWEYYNPKFTNMGRARSGIYRMERLPPSIVEPLLGRR
ncbi:MAG TPA: arylsulfotransferase family protein [Minicystis sp.]|nr:arylsulfotransferase family protein [Minicystis sp.]